MVENENFMLEIINYMKKSVVKMNIETEKKLCKLYSLHKKFSR